jgi:putative protein kinase ArgK-like GTPase of G3E family
MLALGARPAPPLFKTSATSEAGISELGAALELFRGRPAAERAARRRRQAARQVSAIAGEAARARIEAALADNGAMAATVDAVASRTLDPWSAADTLREVLPSRDEALLP